MNRLIQVCRAAITHIGANFPCTQAPGPVLTGYENTELIYADDVVEDMFMPGKPAEIKFKVCFFGISDKRQEGKEGYKTTRTLSLSIAGSDQLGP